MGDRVSGSYPELRLLLGQHVVKLLDKPGATSWAILATASKLSVKLGSVFAEACR
jgi:hypothetical protein